MEKGQYLKNGALVLAYEPIDHQCYKVLAKFGGEYVTWLVDSEGSAFWGHYHGRDYIAALQDYKKRN